MIGFVNRFAYARRKLISIFVLTMKHPDSLIEEVRQPRSQSSQLLVEEIRETVVFRQVKLTEVNSISLPVNELSLTSSLSRASGLMVENASSKGLRQMFLLSRTSSSEVLVG